MSNKSRYSVSLVFLIAGLSSLLWSCAGNDLADAQHSQPTEKTVAEEASAASVEAAPLTVAMNGQMVNRSLVFAGQPTAEELAQFARAGYRVLDLRSASEDRGFDEVEVAAELALDYQLLPVDREALTDPATHEAFSRALAEIETDSSPLLVHCASGNRVAGLYYAHLVEQQQIERELARAKAKELGLTSPGVEQAVDKYLDRETASRDD